MRYSMQGFMENIVPASENASNQLGGVNGSSGGRGLVSVDGALMAAVYQREGSLKRAARHPWVDGSPSYLYKQLNKLGVEMSSKSKGVRRVTEGIFVGAKGEESLVDSTVLKTTRIRTQRIEAAVRAILLGSVKTVSDLGIVWGCSKQNASIYLLRAYSKNAIPGVPVGSLGRKDKYKKMPKSFDVLKAWLRGLNRLPVDPMQESARALKPVLVSGDNLLDISSRTRMNINLLKSRLNILLGELGFSFRRSKVDVSQKRCLLALVNARGNIDAIPSGLLASMPFHDSFDRVLKLVVEDSQTARSPVSKSVSVEESKSCRKLCTIFGFGPKEGCSLGRGNGRWKESLREYVSEQLEKRASPEKLKRMALVMPLVNKYFEILKMHKALPTSSPARKEPHERHDKRLWIGGSSIPSFPCGDEGSANNSALAEKNPLDVHLQGLWIGGGLQSNLTRDNPILDKSVEVGVE